MSNFRVSFTLDGEPAGGVHAIETVEKALERLGKSAGLAQLDSRLISIRGTLGDIGNVLKSVRQDLATLGSSHGFQQLQTGFKQVLNDSRATSTAVRQMRGAFQSASTAASQFKNSVGTIAQGARSGASAINTINRAVNQANRPVRQVQQGLAGWNQNLRQTSFLMQGIVAGSSRLASTLSSRLRVAGAGLGGALGGTAQSIQGAGIGIRMSGIALGNLLSGVGSQGLTGIIKAAIGVPTLGLEIGTRIVSGIAGGVVRAAGGLLATGARIGAGLVEGITSIFGGLTGAGGKLFGGLVSAAASAFTGITNLAGEAVSQIGNIFTGVAEVARGAFQGAVDAVSNVLGGLVDVAQRVVGQVAGVLGTVGKAVLGTGAVIGGFAIRDFVKGESALTSGTILFSPEVTAAQKKDLKRWFFNLAAEVPNIDKGELGRAVELAISTGFQSDPEGLKRFVGATAGLASASDSPELGALTRSAAKTYNLFKEEIDKAAAASGADPFTYLVGSLQQLRNVGDVEFSDMAQRLGEAAGQAKAMGISFREMLEQLALLSLGLGAEQTFTSFERIADNFTNLTKEGKETLDAHKIQVKELTSEEQARLDVLKQQLEAISGQAGATEDYKKKLGDIRREEQALTKTASGRSGKGGTMAKLTPEERARLLSLRSQEAAMIAAGGSIATTGDLKGHRKSIESEISELMLRARNRRPLDIVRDIENAHLSEEELRNVYGSRFGTRGIFVQRALSAQARESVRAGFAQPPGEIGSRAMSERQRTLGFSLGQFWEQLKKPFTSTLFQGEGPILGFFDKVIAKLKLFNEWWVKALADPGAGAFLDNLGTKLGGLFSKLNIDLQGMSTGGFWSALNSGLNTTWEVAGKVVEGVKTLVGWIDNLTGASTALKVIWEGISEAAGWISATGEQLGGGSTANLDKVVQGITGAFRDATAAVKDFGLSITQDLLEAVGRVLPKITEQITNWSETLITGPLGSLLGVLAPLLGGVAAFRGAGALLRGGAAATAAGAAGAAGGAGGVAAAGGGALLAETLVARNLPRTALNLGGAVMRRLAPLAAGFTAYDLLTTPAGAQTRGGFLGNVAGGATLGGSIGGVPGAVIGGLAVTLIEWIKKLVGGGSGGGGLAPLSSMPLAQTGGPHSGSGSGFDDVADPTIRAWLMSLEEERVAIETARKEEAEKAAALAKSRQELEDFRQAIKAVRDVLAGVEQTPGMRSASSYLDAIEQGGAAHPAAWMNEIAKVMKDVVGGGAPPGYAPTGIGTYKYVGPQVQAAAPVSAATAEASIEGLAAKTAAYLASGGKDTSPHATGLGHFPAIHNAGLPVPAYVNQPGDQWRGYTRGSDGVWRGARTTRPSMMGTFGSFAASDYTMGQVVGDTPHGIGGTGFGISRPGYAEYQGRTRSLSWFKKHNIEVPQAEPSAGQGGKGTDVEGIKARLDGVENKAQEIVNKLQEVLGQSVDGQKENIDKLANVIEEGANKQKTVGENMNSRITRLESFLDDIYARLVLLSFGPGSN